MDELKLDVYPEEGKCPLCGGINIIFANQDIDEAGLTYYCECEDCGARYAECYDLVFAGNWNIYDKDGNKYEDLPT